MATKRGDMEGEHYINLEPDSRGITEHAEFSQEQVVRQPSDDRSYKKKLVKRLVLVLKIIGLLLSIVALSFVTLYVMRNEFIGFCSTNPCQNGGTCTGFTNGYSCACATGFEGKDCDAIIDFCSTNPCQNGGTCTGFINGYLCACVTGFQGKDCDTIIDFCSTNPCQNGGTCTGFINGYLCACVTGFQGKDCDTIIDFCSTNPCQNGGTCTGFDNGYSCACVTGFQGKDCDTISPIDCCDILLRGNSMSGVYNISLKGVARQVYCDQDTDGGGWLVFQRRCDGSENFSREWNDYEQGFGDLENEFWIGNAFLASMTNSGNYILRVDLESFKNDSRYAVYNLFFIGPAKSNYTLHIGGYV